MLLLPKTPPLTYPNMKRFKDQKWASLHSLTFHFTIKESSFEGYRPPTPMVIKEIPFKFSTCKTSAGVIKEIHYKMQHVQD